MTDIRGFRRDTQALHAGRNPEANFGVVNPPVYHCSTVLFDSVAALLETRRDRASGAFEGFTYGREGTATTRAFEDAVTLLEGGYRAVTTSCGLGAICASLTAFLSAGDHLLIVDSLYGPARDFCESFLRKFGVEVTYYRPNIGAGIAGLFRENTRVVYMESPGSLTFEMTDVPAITKECRARGIATIFDNTWGSPINFRPLEHGVDVSINAATKYISGHSDLMLGIAVTSEDAFIPVKKTASASGYCGGPDDIYLAMRGLRTLPLRMKQHHASGLAIAKWLRERPEVHRVMHPALPGDPGHTIWERDYDGASGLFGFVLEACSEAQFAAFMDHMDLFKLGYSWGGYESLVVPTYPNTLRSATEWSAPGPAVRIHVGLEAIEDLIADLDRAFARLRAAG
ncbi:cystathionine beta-lyase [Novosphingobium sp. CF614]|uniref:cystathionine beta-lyase n=1 Tax=Novosphingobium sp. CF614 TaxID=1884364 RepID=UPI0008E9680B|nr:cystathionine beta-lyase [Novosphingobium sp. CF614]SFG00347.1 cystathionine beta-lyase [Novosphingobium sp. CF614]